MLKFFAILFLNIDSKSEFQPAGRWHHFVVLLTFFFSTFCYAQNGQLQNFNTKEGLPQSQVYDIVQDSIGYLWLATQGGGLARFDGKTFDVFSEKKGLKSNFINSLFVSNDSLYIGTYSGLSIYSKGKFENFESPKIHNIRTINSQLFLATEKGIYTFQNDSLYPIRTVTEIDINTVTDIVKVNDHYLIATPKGLWKLDQLNTPKSAEKLDVADYSELLPVKDIIYGATHDSGVKVIDNGEITGIKHPRKNINRIFLIDQEFWLATDSEGILVMDERFRLKNQIDQNDGLAINQTRSVLKDKQKNFWITTLGGGLYKLTQNNFLHFNRNVGLKGNRIYAVHKAKDAIWISTSEKGVTRINDQGIQPVFDDKGYLNVKVKTIASDILDNIWAGTNSKGILIFKRKYINSDSLESKSTFNSLNKDLLLDYVFETDTLTIDDELTSNRIRMIAAQGKKMWVATQYNGIIEFDINQKTGDYKVVEYYGTKKGIRDLKINDLKVDRDGKVWYATQGGNLGYVENKKARGFYQVLGKEIAITTMVIKDGFIYLGTLGDGVWIVSKESPKESKKLKGTKELNSQNIYQLIFDEENNLWAGTEKGVNKIVIDENNTIHDVFYFGRSDGFLGIETCQNAVDKDEKGNIWFGTMNGLTKYIPTKSDTTKVKPLIYFEDIEVAYESIDSIDINKYSDVLLLNPSKNHLSFQYKSVDINHPKGIEYRWKLNENVSPWSDKDFIDFANLRDGKYEFTVWSRNIDWIESDPIRFEFFIDKPLYQKTWFLSTIYSTLALILLIIILVTARRIKRNNRQKVAQLKMENHLLSLEQKALQLQMNPHFIFNVLNGIKAMGYEGDTEQMNSTINTFATLLRSILNSSREEEISIQEEINTLQNYLTLEQQMASKPFTFEIQAHTNGIDPEEILIPPMLIQPFVENSVKHGFQHKDIDGKIEVVFNVNGEYLECKIRDNGIGIEKSKLQKKHHHSSTALKVTKERIESLTKDHQLKIWEDNGTIVSFRLPLKTDF